jgi:hypothetical protein
MSQFKTKLIAELVDDENGIWRLTVPLVFESDEIGHVVVPSGFETDFASVPRIPVAYFVAGDTARYAAVVHDYLYSERTVSREVADGVFLEAMKTSGVSWWRRALMHRAVRMFGNCAYSS